MRGTRIGGTRRPAKFGDEVAPPVAGIYSFQHAGSLVQSAASLIRRVRPNQALQRTGNVCGFKLFPRFQPVVALAGR